MHDHSKSTTQTQPADVQVTEHIWIPMRDGVRLAARLWLPANGANDPVPALFEYIPYRKADMVRARDDRNHPYFAAHGYASLRVDMRGSGDSEGRMHDMYSEDELADARQVIDWIATQPWCDGQVGMFGTSWGGTASLQANVDAPGPLKAIIAVCATHDRYEDDIHHMGGCLLTDTFEWGATLPAILAAPPTANVGDNWKTLWEERLADLSFPVEAWVREEARGQYWRHGSVIHAAENLSRPILAIGGWSDRYSNSVMSLVSARPDLVWGVVGPWGHHYPDHANPAPAIGFQALALDWWDRWMRPSHNGPREWPRLQVWLRDFDPPRDTIDRRNGQWIETGPVQQVTKEKRLHLTGRALSDTPDGAAQEWTVKTNLRVGQSAGDTGYFGRPGGLPLDQTKEDAQSLVFETVPLEDDVVLYGSVIASLTLACLPSKGQLSLRLNDVAPDGQVARVAYAVRNLALNDNLDEMPAGTPKETREIDIPLHTTAYRFRKGQRIRLSIAGSYWPLVWPSALADGVKLTGGYLQIPCLADPPGASKDSLPPAEDLPAIKTHEVLAAPELHRSQTTTPDGTLVNAWHQPFAQVRYPDIATMFGYETKAEFRVHPEDPTSAVSSFEHHARYDRPGGTAKIQSSINVSGDAEHFYLEGKLSVCWGDETLIDRQWCKTIERIHG